MKQAQLPRNININSEDSQYVLQKNNIHRNVVPSKFFYPPEYQWKNVESLKNRKYD